MVEHPEILRLLKDSEEELRQEFRGLTESQANFRPGGKWSILDCAEHLALTEDDSREKLEKLLLGAPQPGKKPGFDDDWVFKYGRDRSHAAGPTSENLEPRRKSPYAEAALEHFRKSRARTLRLAETNTQNWEQYLDEEGNFNALQWFLVLATHTQRHVLQIREIKKAPGFPKKPGHK
jgi:DinB superfamily